MVMMLSCLVSLLLLYGSVFLYGISRGHLYRSGGFPQQPIHPISWKLPFQFAADRWYQALESSLFIQLIKHANIALNGEKESVEHTRAFLYNTLLAVYGSAVAGCLFSIVLGGDVAIAIVCWVVAALIPFAMYKQLTTQVNRRRRLILLELPIVLNKIVLLLNAGETLQRSLLVAVGQKEESDHPLYIEFKTFLHHLDNRMSFAQGLEEFARRCAVHEVSLFSNAILLNFKRGGDQLADALRSLSSQLWASRKALARTLGEEASSKLVVPMVIIFLVVMVIVATPALLYLN